MKRKQPSEAPALCSELGPDDGIDPRNSCARPVIVEWKMNLL